MFGLYFALVATLSPALGWVFIAYNLALFVPRLAVLVRRLHDADHSACWWLIGFVPFVGPLILLLFTLQGSRNSFGTTGWGTPAAAASSRRANDSPLPPMPTGI